MQELINRVDIIDVIGRHLPLKQGGANKVACCPFHDEKSPSFTVIPTNSFITALVAARTATRLAF